MAGRISCGLNLTLLNSNSRQSSSSSPPLKTTSHISWRKDDETEPRKKNRSSLVFGAVATIMISTVQITDVATVEAAVVESTVKEVAVRRWSDKRTCPPWFQNSLETIVPENLPRASGHRRLELARLGNRDAPPVGAVVTRVNRGGCFSV